MVKTRKHLKSFYVTQEQEQLLKQLSQKTKVPVAEYIRQGIDLIIEKHRAIIPRGVEETT